MAPAITTITGSSGTVAAAAGPGSPPIDSTALLPGIERSAAAAEFERLLHVLVPPGFTPPAAALLVLAVGLAIWLTGARHLRVALAAGGGIAGGVLAWRLAPPAAGEGLAPWGPMLLAVALGAAGAAAVRRFVAATALATTLAVMAPLAVIAWDGLAMRAAPSVIGEVPAASFDAGWAPLDTVDAGTALPRPASTSPPPAVLARPETDRLPAAAAVPRNLGGLVDRAAERAGTAAGRAATAGVREHWNAARRRLAATLEAWGLPVPWADGGAGSHGGNRRGMLLGSLFLAGAVAGLAIGLAKADVAARAATAALGAALVLLGGLHLPSGLAPGGWIGPDRPEPVFMAWIVLTALGATLQWSYRSPSADIGR